MNLLDRVVVQMICNGKLCEMQPAGRHLVCVPASSVVHFDTSMAVAKQDSASSAGCCNGHTIVVVTDDNKIDIRQI